MNAKTLSRKGYTDLAGFLPIFLGFCDSDIITRQMPVMFYESGA